nr:cellulose binding domain-containing protein [Streptomyces sp. TS71-3]
MTVTNTSTAALPSWRVAWSWAGNQQVSNSWNATVTQPGRAVTALNAAHNGTVAPGASASFRIPGRLQRQQHRALPQLHHELTGGGREPLTGAVRTGTGALKDR